MYLSPWLCEETADPDDPFRYRSPAAPAYPSRLRGAGPRDVQVDFLQKVCHLRRHRLGGAKITARESSVDLREQLPEPHEDPASSVDQNVRGRQSQKYYRPFVLGRVGLRTEYAVTGLRFARFSRRHLQGVRSREPETEW
jgi:hypothetical protein